MTIKWIKTPHKGLRYYEHTTRKHGKKKDRYYSIRLKVDCKDYTYGIGWWSEGIPEEARQNDPGTGFEEYCLSQMKLYKANIKAGTTGPKSPKEKRKIAAEKEAQEQEEQERRAQEAVTFCEVFTKKYFPITKQNKTKRAWATEASLYKLWIEPAIGALPLKSIAPIHLERIKKIWRMQEDPPDQSPMSYPLSAKSSTFPDVMTSIRENGREWTRLSRFPGRITGGNDSLPMKRPMLSSSH